jgi:hypothetical protein
LGGPVHDFREKTFMFCRESPTMQPLGFSGQAARPVALCTGGFSHLGRQTEREKIPSPRKKSVVTTMDREVIFLVHFAKSRQRNFLAEAEQPLNH